MEQLKSMYTVLEMELGILQEQKVVNMMESRLLTISEEAHKANQIRPEVYFAEQLKFQKSCLVDAAEVRRLTIALIELEQFVHYRLTENELADIPVEVQPRKKRFWNRKQKP